MASIPSILVLVVALQGGAEASVRVDVTGVSGQLRRNIRAPLSLVQRQRDTDLLESTVRVLHQRAPEEIGQALRPFGYYRHNHDTIWEVTTCARKSKSKRAQSSKRLHPLHLTS